MSVGDSLVELDQVEQCRARLGTGKVSVPTDAVIAKEIVGRRPHRRGGAADVPDGLEDPRHRPGHRHRVRRPRWPGPAPCSGTARWASSRSRPFAAGTRAVAEAVAVVRRLHRRRRRRQRRRPGQVRPRRAGRPPLHRRRGVTRVPGAGRPARPAGPERGEALAWQGTDTGRKPIMAGNWKMHHTPPGGHPGGAEAELPAVERRTTSAARSSSARRSRRCGRCRR